MTRKTNRIQLGSRILSTPDTLIGKTYTVPEIHTRHFDNSDDYVVVKKTRKGVIKVIKPEVLEEIKSRLQEDL